ncbi:hypothetical protein HELRODRAFT_159492 [Helobdella robusta]|uniref:Uncharacterized protein n=1 Tax=Helobdella robusta TaxID=6412 RepID=T1EP34_HELRO|nr:hypothetical protein HELRODRAFT_159492 [Helobdella robusta]ESO12905.1 hypothetical protein HELRODRAFT_159492 [Helobdella robusta]
MEDCGGRNNNVAQLSFHFHPHHDPNISIVVVIALTPSNSCAHVAILSVVQRKHLFGGPWKRKHFVESFLKISSLICAQTLSKVIITKFNYTLLISLLRQHLNDEFLM